VKYAVIAEAASEYPVSQMCQMLKVSESGYYAWLKRPPSRQHQERTPLKAQIRAIWEQYRRVYGAPRIHDELRNRGICVGRQRVVRLMREMVIAGKSHRKRRSRTTQVDATHPVAPNVLDRQFDDVACGAV
jgi:putative transposase